jgi:hypothetical protein
MDPIRFDVQILQLYKFSELVHDLVHLRRVNVSLHALQVLPEMVQRSVVSGPSGFIFRERFNVNEEQVLYVLR